jgi:4-amino-4-deoxy-L-arabinose transferase-like glycosyltransferase
MMPNGRGESLWRLANLVEGRARPAGRDGTRDESLPLSVQAFAIPDEVQTRSSTSSWLPENPSGYRWAAATVSSTSAASLELSSDGVPVMAIGGFTGSDPAPTLTEFKQFVSQHKIHYFVTSGSGGGFGGSSGDSAQITSWVEAHFTAKTVGAMTVYDLTAPKARS